MHGRSHDAAQDASALSDRSSQHRVRFVAARYAHTAKRRRLWTGFRRGVRPIPVDRLTIGLGDPCAGPTLNLVTAIGQVARKVWAGEFWLSSRGAGPPTALTARSMSTESCLSVDVPCKLPIDELPSQARKLLLRPIMSTFNIQPTLTEAALTASATSCWHFLDEKRQRGYVLPLAARCAR